ncbi:hypothetical protein ACTACU_11525 [Pseudomonas syringae]|uniref:hypothetical protein n=1 Tax=Pseudomonas syringae TaxID=317 RepID=UPI003F86CB7D
MKYLSGFLTKNPLVVVIVFLFSMASAIVTLLLGASDIYDNYLAKTILIPAWLLLLLLVVSCVVWAFYGSRVKLRNARPNELVADAKFGVERVVVGGKRYVSCAFKGSELLIDGRPFDFENCEFIQPHFLFDGPASQTIAILAGMYQDPAFRPLVDDLLGKIKDSDPSIQGD